MGFDKPDLGFVVHLGSPSSPIAYYQQVGRAGRGVAARRGAAAARARRTRRSGGTSPRSPSRPRSRCAGRSTCWPTRTGRCRCRRWRRWWTCGAPGWRPMLKVLDVDGAVRRVQGRLDRHRRSRGRTTPSGTRWVARQREAEQQAMRDYAATTGCRMEFLRRQLDDEEAAPCGRCDNCAGAWFDRRRVRRPRSTRRAGELGRPGRGGGAAPDVADRAARARRRPQGPDPGRASRPPPGGRWAGSPTSAGATGCAPLLGPASAGRPGARRCDRCGRDGARGLGAAATGPWPGAGRSAWSPSASRTPAAAGRIARASGSPRSAGCRCSAMDRVGGRPPGSRAAHQQRAAGAGAARRVRRAAGAGRGAAGLAGRCCSSTTMVDSGWTMAVAARLLRQAGAAGVLPFALATT